MTSVLAATSRQETPVFFRAGGHRLFGVFTRPTADPVGVAVVVLPGAEHNTSTGRNRFTVRLCRRLAVAGYHAMRLDYHGVGESTGTIDRFRLDDPFVQDLDGTVRWIERQGVHRFVLVGWCFGARTSLAYAAEAPGVQGLVLISVPVRDYERGERSITRVALEESVWAILRRGLRPATLRELVGDERRRRRVVRLARAKGRVLRARLRGRGPGRGDDPLWVSPQFVDQVGRLVSRRVPVLFVFGTGDDVYEDFVRARAGRLGHILEAGERTAQVVVLEGQVHGLSGVRLQDDLLGIVQGWLGRGRVGPPTRAG